MGFGHFLILFTTHVRIIANIRQLSCSLGMPLTRKSLFPRGSRSIYRSPFPATPPTRAMRSRAFDTIRGKPLVETTPGEPSSTITQATLHIGRLAKDAICRVKRNRARLASFGIAEGGANSGVNDAEEMFEVAALFREWQSLWKSRKRFQQERVAHLGTAVATEVPMLLAAGKFVSVVQGKAQGSGPAIKAAGSVPRWWLREAWRQSKRRLCSALLAQVDFGELAGDDVRRKRRGVLLLAPVTKHCAFYNIYGRLKAPIIESGGKSAGAIMGLRESLLSIQRAVCVGTFGDNSAICHMKNKPNPVAFRVLSLDTATQITDFLAYR